MTKKLDPKVFVMAAESIANKTQDYCCLAVYISAFDEDPFATEEYKYFFKENFRTSSPYSLTEWWPPEEKEARIQALLLCAEMVKDENRKNKKR